MIGSKLAALRSNIGARVLAVSVGLSVPVMAFATPAADPFTAAITAMTEKVGIYAAALVGLGAVGVGFMVALKYVKKIPRAT